MIARIRRLLRPPTIVAGSRTPAGWLVRSRGRLRRVVLWGIDESGVPVGLIAGRRGLRRAPRFGGYLPPTSTSLADLQQDAPAVAFPVADLVEAIGDLTNPWTSEAQAAIYSRLRIAAELEWAGAALLAFVADPDKFLRRHLEMLVEHGRAADLDESERDFLAGLLTGNQDVRSRAEGGSPRRVP